jgi:hypothetical protein
MSLSQDDIRSLMTEKAARDLRMTQVPVDASGYEVKLPQDFRVPVGSSRLDPRARSGSRG